MPREWGYGFHPTSFVHGTLGLEGTGRPVSHMCGWAYPCSPQAEDGGRISHLIALIALLGVVLLALVGSASGYRFATGE